MSYNKFNEYIYHHFFNDENIGETIILAVDDSIISDFCNLFEITKEELDISVRQKYRHSWDLTLTEEMDIPQYIGFIAIQIYLASQMQNEGDFSDRQFNPRLSQYLDISTNKLQELYRLYQDSLWQGLVEWTTENNFNICIPEMKSGKGRFVQYPLSQALLNKEDLKNAPKLFENVGLKLDENLNLGNFTTLITDSDRYIFPTHYYRVKTRLMKEGQIEMLYMQLFDFYNNVWNGEYPEEEEEKREKGGKRYVIHKSKTNLVLDNQLENLEIVNHQNEVLRRFALNNSLLFGLINKEYRLFYSNLLIFSKDVDYNEWVDCRYLNLGEEQVIVCMSHSIVKLKIHELDQNYEDFSNQYFSIFKVRLSNEMPNHYYWDDYLYRVKKNYKFEFGLKLSRNAWMLGAGPMITFTEETDVWINGKKQILNEDNLCIYCRDYPHGTYRLKVKGCQVERFSIEKPAVFHIDDKHGWQIDKLDAKWQPNEDKYQIEGLSTCFPIQTEKTNARTWINALTKQNKNKNAAVVINAIKRSRYGI